MTTPQNPPLVDSECDGQGDLYYFTQATLRDLFAGFAMVGILSNPEFNMDPKDVAELAGRNADAMLKERAK